MSPVPITEQTITAALRQLPTDRWQQVLAFIDSLQPTPAAANPGASGQRWTAKELRKLPPAERDAILAQQATALVDDTATTQR